MSKLNFGELKPYTFFDYFLAYVDVGFDFPCHSADLVFLVLLTLEVLGVDEVALFLPVIFLFATAAHYLFEVFIGQNVENELALLQVSSFCLLRLNRFVAI